MRDHLAGLYPPSYYLTSLFQSRRLLILCTDEPSRGILHIMAGPCRLENCDLPQAPRPDSIVPETQHMAQTSSPPAPCEDRPLCDDLPERKTFIAAPEALEDADLAHGFIFASKAPNPPGQFSKRPSCAQSEMTFSADKSESPQSITPRISAHDRLHEPPRQLRRTPPPTSPFPKETATPTGHHMKPHSTGERANPENQAATTSEPATVKRRFYEMLDPSGSACAGQYSQRKTMFPRPRELGESHSNAAPQTVEISTACEPSPPRPTGQNGHQRPQVPIKIASRLIKQTSRPASSRSICGDLSSPSRAVKQHRSEGSRGTHGGSSLTSDGSDPARDGYAENRSGSRASNVSRKRTVGPNHRVSKRGRKSDRHRQDFQETLLRDMTLHWNKWLKQASDDRDELLSELAFLHDEKSQQEHVLERVTAELGQRNQAFEYLETQFERLQRSQQDKHASTRHIEGELNDLRKRTEISEKRSQGAQERSKAIRTKVNEAITEHQNLFKKAQAYYTSLSRRLSSERDASFKSVEDAEKAIEKVKAQRKATNEIITYLRDDMETKSHLRTLTHAFLRSESH